MTSIRKMATSTSGERNPVGVCEGSKSKNNFEREERLYKMIFKTYWY